MTLTVGRINGGDIGGDSKTGFFVEDDGSGIPPASREEVFDHGYTTSEEGTGFGLSIVRHVAEAHNWSVELTEGSEGGVRFEFTDVELAWELTSQ